MNKCPMLLQKPEEMRSTWMTVSGSIRSAAMILSSQPIRLGAKKSRWFAAALGTSSSQKVLQESSTDCAINGKAINTRKNRLNEDRLNVRVASERV